MDNVDSVTDWYHQFCGECGTVITIDNSENTICVNCGKEVYKPHPWYDPTRKWEWKAIDPSPGTPATVCCMAAYDDGPKEDVVIFVEDEHGKYWIDEHETVMQRCLIEESENMKKAMMELWKAYHSKPEKKKGFFGRIFKT